MTYRRSFITDYPYPEFDRDQEWHLHGLWPACWVHGAQTDRLPAVMAYRRIFTLDRAATLRAHISGDERYTLFIDGKRIGRGSEFGDRDNWYYETYDLAFEAGTHAIVALVWSLGEMAPYAQMSVRHGFIFAPEEPWLNELATGIAPWECKAVTGVAFVDPRPAFGTGFNLVVDGAAYPWGIEGGCGDGWQPVLTGQPGTNARLRNNISPSHLMRPATLPAMIDRPVRGASVRFVSNADAIDSLCQLPIELPHHLSEEATRWQQMLDADQPLTIPPYTCRRVLVDLRNYYCAYPELIVTSGAGSAVKIDWAESLFESADGKTKGHRDAIDGRYFVGVGDRFIADGGGQRVFSTLWWQAGRYVQVCVETADEPLRIDAIHLHETRYPLELESSFSCSDAQLNDVIPLAFRALQLCAHETYIDCPYYEQMMYSGDSRLAGLATLVSSRDDRLLRKAIDMFDYSRLSTGMTQSRYPCRVRQVIAPFTLLWIGMVYDFALWRDRTILRQHLPGVRATLEAFLALRRDDGLIANPDGWNFMDWVGAWRDGEHRGLQHSTSGIINLQLAYTLQQAAEMEAWAGEPELHARWARAARGLFDAATRAFWNADRGLFADDIQHEFFSEHAQCFAVLSGRATDEQSASIANAWRKQLPMERATISFTHYLFEACRLLGLTDIVFDRMDTWRELKGTGFVTTPEQPEPTRSDCHGWGAHILYHFHATALGVRPADPGFGQVRITPMLGPFSQATGRLIHPQGWIDVHLHRQQDELHGTITLPAGVGGELVYAGQTVALPGGGPVSIRLADREEV